MLHAEKIGGLNLFHALRAHQRIKFENQFGFHEMLARMGQANIGKHVAAADFMFNLCRCGLIFLPVSTPSRRSVNESSTIKPSDLSHPPSKAAMIPTGAMAGEQITPDAVGFSPKQVFTRVIDGRLTLVGRPGFLTSVAACQGCLAQ